MKYISIINVDDRELKDCINAAFSDYAVPICFTQESLQKFFAESNIDRALSFCAYSDDVMVGFILNSSNIYNGERAVFDAGTGVIPGFRGREVFSALYAFAEQELRRYGIKKYYLEVLQQNGRAKALYERQGFSVVREFAVMRLENISEKIKNSNIYTVSFSEFDFADINNLTLVKPSYEHSYNVIKNNVQLYNAAYIKDKEDITAFCIYNIEDGRIIELGYGNILDLKEVIIYLASSYKIIIAKNIDTSYCDVTEMFLSAGFKQIASQYEMVKEI